jgi:dTDP-4-amino-4,6-dideoxygalactose transaminase/acetyltransferase-like isoleucine patch superfamily enzyme
VPPSLFIHPTAIVEPGAEVGDGTTIWHQCHLRGGSAVGTGCILGKNVYVDAGVRIGDRVKIQNNVSVYQGVELADDVFVGPSAVFTNDLRPRAGNKQWQLTRTWVRCGASVGANATIVCGVEIGEFGMVGAGAVVTAPVRPHQLVTGNPARHHGWVCACGEIVSRTADSPPDLRCGACRGENTAEPDPGAQERERILLTRVTVGTAEEQAVLDVLRSGRLAGGAQVAELERCFARAHGADHAVAVCNGTAALVAALRAHGVGPGDEVITTPLTFVATLNAILEVGATARFADVADDLTLDPAAVARLVTSQTRALIPVHLYGLPAAMEELSGLARSRDLVVIADAAQAHGASVAARPAGSFGTATFSLYGTKNITCGEGGIVTTNDAGIAERVRLLRNHGMRDRYDYAMPAYNYRLTDLQAAIAIAQLQRLPHLNARRASNASRLSAGLAGLPGLLLPRVHDDRAPVWHQYTVRVTAEARMDRDQLSKYLDAAAIESRPYYPKLVHDYPCYQDHPQVICDETPRADEAVRQVLSLPVHPALSDADIDRIVTSVRTALAG